MAVGQELTEPGRRLRDSVRIGDASGVKAERLGLFQQARLEAPGLVDVQKSRSA